MNEKTSPGSTAADKHMRLDQMLVAHGYYATRSRAQDAIRRGKVRLDSRVCDKPGQTVRSDVEIAVDDPAGRYVSRAAVKLIAALDAFRLDPQGRSALDVGSSTGGFTQVLLERGARHVVAVDVGHGQMDATLAADPRVTLREGLNARALARADLEGNPVDCLVSDVSFISLRLALPPALELAESGAFCVLLVKPQFEAGRAAIGKGGVLADPAQGLRIAAELAAWLDEQQGWRSLGTIPSPIRGGDGNAEFLMAGVKA